ncbi:DNA-3-methyladenine glycosylase, partial [Patulibacter sp.]|uniref:DNA-3-methyladenine glycosylase family protein n=1 Tax=Patulibacter sp. TaxID=1912859 RepID=UPI00271F269C
MPTTVQLRLPVRAPFDGRGLHGVLGARAADGLERVGPDGAYVRSLRLPHGAGLLSLRLTDAGLPGTGPDGRDPDAGGTVTGELRLVDPRDAAGATVLVRRLLDLDADPATVGAHLARDPALAPLVAARPGLRVLGTVDPFELALRAVIGQQVSVAAARTVLGRLVRAHGRELPRGMDPDGAAAERLRTFPEPAVVADLPDAALPMPRARAATVRRLAVAVADGTVDLRPAAEPHATVAALLALPGIGRWTAGYVAMRALGDRDAFPAGDLVL